ncbi:MAG TPA: hypothetical protein VGB14_07920 [Acidimicrobiales bacterium]|jgi:uncharacterized delta-60 repeat protein
MVGSVLAAAAVLAVGVAVSPGALDPSWSGDGVATLDLGDDQRASEVLALPDGGVLVAGSEWALGGVLVRYGPDGRLDRTFGGGDGVVGVRIGGRATGYAAAARRDDGTIVAAGSTDLPEEGDGGDVLVVRHLADGSLDPTFGGGDGWVVVYLDGIQSVDAVAVLDDGGVAVATIGFGAAGAVVRLTADGDLDAAFDGDGVVELPGLGGWDVVATAGGGVVVAGDADGVPALFALRADGSPDPAFGGGDGVATVDAYGAGSELHGVARHSSGFFATGSGKVNRHNDDLLVAAFDATGALDARFSGDGIFVAPLGNLFDQGNAVAVQPDGGVLVLGQDHTGTGASGEVPVLLRLRVDGHPDQTFGGTGLVRFPSRYFPLRALAVTPAGAVVAGDRYDPFGGRDGIAVFRIVI